jgi:hypothetical protein
MATIEQLNDIVIRCLARIQRWKVPSNWSRSQWIEEMSAQAKLAAAMECGMFDKQNGSLRKTNGLESRIQNNLLKRYRQEWSFARHCCGHFTTVKPAEPDTLENDLGLMLSALGIAMAALSESDRRLIEMLYCQQRNESQVAAEMRVCQSAISKHKRRILSKLSNAMKNNLQPFTGKSGEIMKKTPLFTSRSLFFVIFGVFWPVNGYENR